MKTWRELIADAAGNDEIIACTLSDVEIDEYFDDLSPDLQGEEFTAWSNDYVYFPVVYDGFEWVGRAPRNPCDQKTGHQGDK